jgi:hypothetical protein
MYNTFYRATIADNEVRKFLDTFVGPTTSFASMLRIFRNGSFSLTTRIALDIFLPLTRPRALYLLQNFSFTLLKNTIFSELYLHQRIWRHIFENACSFIGSSTYYAVFRYKQAYLDATPSASKRVDYYNKTGHGVVNQKSESFVKFPKKFVSKDDEGEADETESTFYDSNDGNNNNNNYIFNDNDNDNDNNNNFFSDDGNNYDNIKLKNNNNYLVNDMTHSNLLDHNSFISNTGNNNNNVLSTQNFADLASEDVSRIFDSFSRIMSGLKEK